MHAPAAKDLLLEFRYSGQSWLCFRVYRNGCGPLSSVTSRVLRRLVTRYFVGGIGLLFSAFLRAAPFRTLSWFLSNFVVVGSLYYCGSPDVSTRHKTVTTIPEWKRSTFKIKRDLHLRQPLLWDLYLKSSLVLFSIFSKKNFT